MLSYKTDIPIDKIENLFCNVEGFNSNEIDRVCTMRLVISSIKKRK
ncbi:hypothetical protein [Clostridium culturomicium]|nr:hypothetical protein [Clostridium culturomicium]